MPINARYGHTNLVAKDWRQLARFYQDVFGCVPVPPERDLHGPELEAGTALPGAQVRGVHLRLPGWGESGPTLEIFSYSPELPREATTVNRPGFGHIAFVVDDVAAAYAAVLAAGGRTHGEIVTLTIGSARVTWVYVTDPEGNIVELQSWTSIEF